MSWCIHCREYRANRRFLVCDQCFKEITANSKSTTDEDLYKCWECGKNPMSLVLIGQGGGFCDECNEKRRQRKLEYLINSPRARMPLPGERMSQMELRKLKSNTIRLPYKP